MAQIISFALCPLDLDTVRIDRLARPAARLPQRPDRVGLVFQTAIGIEQPPMGRGIDQRTVVVLAVNFDQSRAEAFQRLHADRLVVDEGAGLAVGELHAPQDERVLRLDTVLLEQRPGRVPARQFEHRSHLPLRLALAHQRRVAARAQGEREGVEQDRFAGAGLAGQHSQTFCEIQIELVDQDDVPDGKARQHAEWLPVTLASRRKAYQNKTETESGRLENSWFRRR